MGQVIPVLGLYTEAFGGSNYSTPFGRSGATDSSILAEREIPISLRGVLTQFYMKLSNAPGEGNYHQFTLIVNGSSSGLDLRFDDDEVEKTIRCMVLVEPGDRMYMRFRGSSPAQAWENIASLVLWTETSTESMLAGVGTRAASNEFGGLMGTSRKSHECVEYLIAGHGGTLSDLYVRLETAPGAGKYTSVTVRVNGANSSIVATINGTNKTGNDTAHTAVISQDDKINVEVAGDGATGDVKYSLKFTSTADYFLIGGGFHSTVIDVPATTTAMGRYDTTLFDRQLASGHDLYLTRMSVHLERQQCLGNAPPGAGKSRTATLTSTVFGSSEEDTELAVVIADANYAGADTGDVQIPKGSHFRLKWEESGSPAACEAPIYGFSAKVIRVEPTVSTDKIVKATAYGTISVVGDGGSCSVRGFCYKEATSGDPNVFDDSWEVDGGDEEDDGEFATGEFTVALPLVAGKLYRVRAFAVNDTSLAYATTKAAYFEYPSDSVARVSSIRRIYRPGLYRMEVSVGDLGFDVEVSEAAIKRVPDEVSEPEVPPEEGKEPVVYQPGGFTEEQMMEIIALQQAIYPTEIPPWATKTTMPELYPPILYPSGQPAEAQPTNKRFTVTYRGRRGARGTTTVMAKDADEARRIISGRGFSVLSVKQG